MSHQGKLVSQYLDEDLEAHVKKTNRPILLNMNCFYTLRQQNYRFNVKAI
jgi:hypothetical protein